MISPARIICSTRARVNHSKCMSCSSCSRSGSPSADIGGQEHPAALAAHPRSDVETAEHRHRVGPQTGLLAQLADRELGRLEVGPSRRGALRELPPARTERVAELLDEGDPIAVGGDDQGVGRFVDDAVDAGGAVRPANRVLAHGHPGIAVDLAGGDAGRWDALGQYRGSLADVLLASLNPAAVAAGADIGDAVRIDGAVLSRSDLVGAATSVAERVGGAHRIAILATPTAATVLAVTGCLIAGVPFVPVPADVGVAERAHMLTDSGAQAWLGELPDETGWAAARAGAAARPVVAPLSPSRRRRAPRW